MRTMRILWFVYFVLDKHKRNHVQEELLVVEGTSGSTDIALAAALSVTRGHTCLLVLPDDQATKKQAILWALGAVVYVVPMAAISNPNHYVKLHIESIGRTSPDKIDIQAVFMNQFENQPNFDSHYHVTAPELLEQFCFVNNTTRNNLSLYQKQTPVLDAFVMSAGTGIRKYFKERSHYHCHIVLVDPPGSSLYHKIKHGVAFAIEQCEQTLQRHRYDWIMSPIIYQWV